MQTKLAISEPSDANEQEADRVADRVMAAPAPHDVSGAPPLIQRFSRQSNGQMDAMPTSVDKALASPGRPLESALRQDMEQRFGHDFSQVRVHSGSAAEQSARDVSAHAYTVGHNVVFGAGRFMPGTHEGRRLIAHELTHVVQQSRAAETASTVQRFTTCESREQCPQPESGEIGRARRGTMFVSGVSGSHQGLLVANFAVGEATLKNDLANNPVWANFWGQMVTKPHIRWEVLGFSDCQGAEGTNELLRWERAIAVNNALPQLARDQVDAFRAAPLTDCMASNADERDRTHNRSAFIRQTNTEYTFPEVTLQGEPLQFPYKSGLDPELGTGFNRMVIALKNKGIGFGSIDDVRPASRAHILSTGFHIHTEKVSLEDLQALKDGKDLDGNVWYKKEWEQSSTYLGLGAPGEATAEQILEKAKANAFELVQRECSDCVSGGEINCAYEGYESADTRRKPNVPAVPISNHVTGRAIDLSGIDWDKLGGRWSDDARKFVADFGLTRPFSPEATTYCVKEHWHFELAEEMPTKGDKSP